MTTHQFDSLIWRVHNYHPEIIKRVVYSIPDLIIQNPESTYADLAMGGGQFLQGILNRCIELGQSKEQILPRLCGFERSKVYLNYARWRNNLQGVNLAILDPERDLDSVSMKFDVVIGNPPYQGGDLGKAVYKSLWPLFWAKSFSLVKPGGVISLITPLTWCAPTADLSKKDAIDGETRLWKVFEKYSTLADVTTVKNFFPGVGSSFSAVTVDTSGDSGLTFTNGFSSNLGFYPLSGAEEVQEQLSLTNNISTNLKVSGRITPGIRVSLLNTRKINEQNVEICQSMEFPKTNAEPTLYSHIYCKDEEEAEYVRSRILDCADILYKHCRYHGFLNMNVLGMISLNLSQC